MLDISTKAFCFESGMNQHKLALAWQITGKTREEKSGGVRGKHMALSGVANATANTICSMTSGCKRTSAQFHLLMLAEGH